MKKKILIVILILCILMLAFIPLYATAKATAIPAPIPAEGVEAVILQLLIACGLTFEAVEDGKELSAMEKVANSLYNDLTEEELEEIRIASDESATVVWNGIKGVYEGSITLAVDIWERVKSWVDSNYSSGINEIELDEIVEIDYNDVVDTNGYIKPWNLNDLKYDIDQVFVRGEYYNHLGTVVELEFNFYTDGSGNQYIDIIENGVLIETKQGDRWKTPWLIWQQTEKQLDFHMISGNGGSLKNVQYFAMFGDNVNIIEVTAASEAIDDPDWTWDAGADESGNVRIPFVPDISKWINGMNDYIDAEKTRIESVGKDYNDIVVDHAGTIDIPRSTTYENEAVDDYEAVDEALEHAGANTSMKALFFSKFPFCLPWDLTQAIKLMASPAEAPRWEVDLLSPLRGRYSFANTTWDIDMGNYEIIGQVSRWVTTISFVIALIVLTRSIIRS